MTASSQQPIVLHADQEHNGLRVLIFVLAVVSIWLGYQIVALLIRTFAPGRLPEYTMVISCLAGVPLGLLLVWFSEQLLKRVWHSGNSVTLGEQSIELERRDGERARFTPSESLMVTNWFFRLSGYPRGGRERRVSSKWFCLACELQQDDNRWIVYTFMPPKRAVVWTEDEALPYRFEQIFPADLYQKSFAMRFTPPVRPEIPADLLRGKHGRVWLAERRRWQSGLELVPADFDTFMRFIQSS